MKLRKRRTGYWKKVVSGMLCAAMLCTTLGIPASGHTASKEKTAAEARVYSETSENKETFRTAAEDVKAEKENKSEVEKKEEKEESEKKPETEKQTEKTPETEKQTEKKPETEKEPETEKQTEKMPETEKQTEKAPETEKQTEKKPETEKTDGIKEPESESEKAPKTEQTPETDTSETETEETETEETEAETESETEETDKKEGKNKKKRASAPPIKIDDFVIAGDAESGKKTQLRYRMSNEEAWQELGSEPIPGNAHIRLDVLFGRVPLDDLVAAGGKLVYQLPEIMRDPVVSGEITAGTHAVGVIEVENKTVTLTFHQEYLEQMEAGGADSFMWNHGWI